MTIAPMIRTVRLIQSVTDDVRCLFLEQEINCFHNGLLQSMQAKKSRSQFMVDGAMDKEKVAKMLGYFKYHKREQRDGRESPGHIQRFGAIREAVLFGSVPDAQLQRLDHNEHW